MQYNNTGSHDAPIAGFVCYNFTSGEFANSTVTGIDMGGVIQMGGMQYISNFGQEGILVVIGGDQVGKVQRGWDDLLSLETVWVYDIAYDNWFAQQTTGNVPEPRKEFCMTGIASNNQTYEILVYAGWDGQLGPDAVPLDEAFVLTLPAFQWIKVSYPAASPRLGVQCTPVGGSQILTVGGADAAQNGPHDVYSDVFNSTDPFNQGLNIFDMNKLAFASTFSANPPEYTAATVIQEFYASK